MGKRDWSKQPVSLGERHLCGKGRRHTDGLIGVWSLLELISADDLFSFSVQSLSPRLHGLGEWGCSTGPGFPRGVGVSAQFLNTGI